MSTRKLCLTCNEVVILETLLEDQIERLEQLHVYCGCEKELLTKIHSVSSAKNKKFTLKQIINLIK